MWEQYKRITKPNAAIVLTASQPFTSALIMSNIKMFRYEWMWLKNNSTGFQHANKMPLKKHENICVFYRKQSTYNPQGLLPYGKVNKRGSMGENWMEGTKHEYVQEFTNFPTQILEFSKDKGFHPTQKPVALMEYLIKTYTNEGEIVLDNTFGSCTTGVACVNLGRKFIGIEMDENYYNVGKERVLKVISDKKEK